MAFETDVLVVGAGPAGAAAAAWLARAGVETLMIDRARFPRDKCCGDGLTTLALRELEALGLEPAELESWFTIDHAVIRSPSSRETIFPLPSGAGQYAAVVRRRELDAALVELSRSEGASVAEGCAIDAIDASDDRIVATVDGMGEVEARWVVAADGMWSPVRKHLGLAADGYRGEWHAFRQYFEDVGPRASRELMVWFEADLLPGYAWSFPLPGGRCNVGFGIQRGGRHRVGDMKGLWPALLERPHIRDFLGAGARAEGPHRAWPIPARVGRIPLTGPRTLFVGDAAAVTDPMTGEGIGQALVTGRLAATALSRPDEPDRAGCYDRSVRGELMADDRMARLLTRMLRRPGVARAAIRLAGSNPWARRNFARWMFEDYPRAIVATPRRWERGMFGAPGAFDIESSRRLTDPSLRPDRASGPRIRASEPR